MLLVYHRFSNPSLDFVAAPALAPAEVSVDPELMAKYNQELAQVRIIFIILPNLLIDSFCSQAEAVPLPEEDDDL